MATLDLPPHRRRRLLRRGGPVLAGLAAAALAGGALYGALRPSAGERAAERFAAAWEEGDLDAMHRLLTPAARRRSDRAAFGRAYRRAAATATLAGVEAGGAREADGRVVVPITARTRVFGRVRADLALPVVEERIAWREHLTFPGVPAGVELGRRSAVPERAPIAARGGEVLARGPAASRRVGLAEVGASIAGSVGPAETGAERERVYARGFPRDQPVGRSGLERILETRLAGRPGGELRAGARVLARTRPRPAAAVRTTIDVGTQRGAARALGGRFGGIAALDARTGEVRALAGIAFSAPQPPGSTFKIVTTAAALEAGIVRLSSRFPVETRAVIDGVELENANGESCGGTLVESFAESCNSVFAPLGIRLGARRLVAAAERFGFNRDPRIPGAARSTIPPAAELRSKLELGSTAIGQGRLLATPLLLAQVSQAVAADGVMHPPRFVPGAAGGRPRRVMERGTARRLERLMTAVVSEGTGRQAAIDGVRVAGKTGTAELEDTTDDVQEAPSETQTAGADTADTDAWFTAYAPAGRPRLAVAVLFVRAGAGGDTAAPAARIVLEAGLR